MQADGRGILGQLEATDSEISQAWGHAIESAFREHQRAGVPIATWSDELETVILIPASDLSLHNEAQLEAVPLDPKSQD